MCFNCVISHTIYYCGVKKEQSREALLSVLRYIPNRSDLSYLPIPGKSDVPRFNRSYVCVYTRIFRNLPIKHAA